MKLNTKPPLFLLGLGALLVCAWTVRSQQLPQHAPAPTVLPPFSAGLPVPNDSSAQTPALEPQAGDRHDVYHRYGIPVDTRLSVQEIDDSSYAYEVTVDFAKNQDSTRKKNVLELAHGMSLGPSRSAMRFESRAIFIGHTFDTLYASWTTLDEIHSVSGKSSIQITVRTSMDGQSWTDWKTLSLDTEGHALGGNSELSTLLGFDGGQRFFQYAVQIKATDDGTKPAISRINFVVLSDQPTQPKYQSGQSFDPPEQHAQAMRPAAASATATFLSRPTMVTRVQWNCPEGENSRLWRPAYTSVTHMPIHHTADSQPSSGGNAKWVYNEWYFHTYGRGWGDIGYNYLIAPDGTLYEGRAGGDNVIGAHFSCANTGTMGTVLLGDFQASDHQPAFTKAAVDSLRRLLAWKAQQQQLKPYLTSWHPATALTLYPVLGHRDANATTAPGTCEKGTACPGDTLYATFPTLRADVVALLDTDVQAKNAGYFNGIQSNTFGSNLNWDVNYELRWQGYTYSFNNTLYGSMIYQATYKADRRIRYTAYYDYVGIWHGWFQATI